MNCTQGAAPHVCEYLNCPGNQHRRALEFLAGVMKTFDVIQKELPPGSKGLEAIKRAAEAYHALGSPETGYGLLPKILKLTKACEAASLFFDAHCIKGGRLEGWGEDVRNLLRATLKGEFIAPPAEKPKPPPVVAAAQDEGSLF